MRIYGIIKNIEDLSEDELYMEIKNRYERIRYVKQAIMYADGPAYYQDKQYIDELYNEVMILKSFIADKNCL
jgi:hypothetical protein